MTEIVCYRKERASLVKDFGDALKDGNPSAVYSKLSEKNRVANDALENARARRRSREFAMHGAKENKIPKPKVNQVICARVPTQLT